MEYNLTFLGTSQTEVPSELGNSDLSYDSTTESSSSQVDHQIVMEHNYAEYPSGSDNNSTENKNTENETLLNKHEVVEGDRIIIKLKYINDDLKMVEGNLDELLGDFKK